MKKIQETIVALKSQGIHSVLTQFCDIHGVAKGKLVPLDNLQEWVEQGAGFAGPSIWGTGLPRYGARSEYYGRVQLHSLKALPFMPGVAHAVCDGYAGGKPLDTCSRQLLQKQVQRIQDRGWTLWVGIEPEFFLLRQSAQGREAQGRKSGARKGDAGHDRGLLAQEGPRSWLMRTSDRPELGRAEPDSDRSTKFQRSMGD